MNRLELVAYIARIEGIDAHTTARVLDRFTRIVGVRMRQGTSVKIRGFGTFRTRERKRTSFCTPAAGHVQVPTRKVPHFQPAKSLTNKINNPVS